MELREILDQYGFPVMIRRLFAVPRWRRSSVKTDLSNPVYAPILELMEAVDEVHSRTGSSDRSALLLSDRSVMSITGRGTVVTVVLIAAKLTSIHKLKWSVLTKNR